MACKCCLEFLLKLLNFLLTLVGLAMIGYGIYLFVEYKQSASSLATDVEDLFQLGRPLLMSVTVSGNISLNLPKAWFIYLFIGVGVILFVISCFGCIGAVAQNGCCICFYSTLILLLLLVELGFAAFIYFDKNWSNVVYYDKTGNFYTIYSFIKKHWAIAKWVALGAFLLQAFVFLLALVVRGMNSSAVYDSDDELIAPRQQIRQTLIHRQPATVQGVAVAPVLDQRPTRNDAWSTRMREKYGLDTSEFTYNPSEAGRYQQVPSQQVDERSRCVVM